MAKKITAVVKLQLPAGKATPGPPVGSTLGPHGINIPGFTKEFNEKTAKQAGMIIPVIITIYADRSFSFIMKTPRPVTSRVRPPFLSRRLAVSRRLRVLPIKQKSLRLPKRKWKKSQKSKCPTLTLLLSKPL